jgi:hypothetical protein
MEGQGGGSIVNVTTYATFEPSLWFPASCVYRAGVAIVFGERLDAPTLAGAAIIVGAGSYTLWREAGCTAAARLPTGRPAAVRLAHPPSRIQPGPRPAPAGRGRRDPSLARNHADETRHRRRLGRSRRGQSGIGRGLGRWGLAKHLETKQNTELVSEEPWGRYLK